MATTVRVTMNGPVVGQFLRGEVGTLPAELMRRAGNVARAAGPGYKADGRKGKHRYRTTVSNRGLRARGDADPRATLLRALDAGRQD